MRSILHSSPSMSSMVIVESAMEMTSSAERQARPKHICLILIMATGVRCFLLLDKNTLCSTAITIVIFLKKYMMDSRPYNKTSFS